MRIRGITISDMPNILFNCEPDDTGYFGYQGFYASAICPVCGKRFYYNQKYYPEGQTPRTCGRYNCLREVFCHV